MTDSAGDNALKTARDAIARHEWRDAFDLLAPLATTNELNAGDLEAFADSAWWTGHFEECIDGRERAYGLYTSAGENRAAARVALNLRNDYGHKLASAVSAGWLARAERLLESEQDSPEYAMLLRAHINSALDGGEFEEAYRIAGQMLELADRLKDMNLQALAIHEQGRALVRMGKVDEGLALLDEAAVAAISGDLDPVATATIYCNVIGTCRALADYRRAGDWTEAAKRWCERQAITGFPGICRVYRAEIMRLRGDWAMAESEARLASDELQEWALDIVGAAFNEIGEIRLRMGELEDAEEAFRQAHETGLDPQPGLAMLRLAQGNTRGAASAIRRALDEKRERLERGRLLPAGVEIAVATGDLNLANAYADELEDIARAYDTPALHAAAGSARGAVLLAEGDCGGALRTLRQSSRLWTEIDAPYESARTRVTLAEAYRADGDEQSARLELEAAKAAFQRLGALPDAQRVIAMLEEKPAPAVASTSRETKTFMFTDVCSSTNLVEVIGDEAWEHLLRWHDQTLRSLFAEHEGEEIKQLGEGFFVAFEAVEMAVECAVAIQRRLAEHRKTSGFSPQLRIGLHASEATRRGKDYGGIGVHVAARVGALGGAGEIVCSRETLAFTDGLSYRVTAVRSVQLKGIAEPVEIATIDWRSG
jgi:class 3 adenylate cyclase